jgi:ribosomal protein S6--L-glutamate ligase
MRLCVLAVRRVPPVPSPVLLDAYARLRGAGVEVETVVMEEVVLRADALRARHDLYVLKSHTQLSLSVAGVLAEQGVRMLNPYASCVTTQNKIVASQRLRRAGVPIPPGWVTGELQRLKAVVSQRPLIVKPYQGHRGAGVSLAREPSALDAIPDPEVPMLAQEWVAGPGEDLKVYVVGEAVCAVRKPFSADSFARAGVPCAVDPEVRDIALRCGRAFGLGLYGLDLIEGPDGPVVVDLNYFPGYKGVPGAGALIAEYVLGYARDEVALRLPPLAELEGVLDAPGDVLTGVAA